ncbi:hypothetical protein MASR2M78_26090 [Treponema sp.]
MVIKTRRRFLLFIIAFMAGVGSCVLNGFDPFPAYLMKTEAGVDLSDAFRRAGFTGEYWVGRMEEAKSPIDNSSRLLILVAAKTQIRIFVLQPDTMALLGVLDEAFLSPFLGTDAAGRFLCGAAVLSLDGKTTSPLIELGNALMTFSDHFSLNSLPVYGDNYLLGVNGLDLQLVQANSDWQVTNSIQAPLSMPLASSYYPKFIQAIREHDTNTDKYHLLFSRANEVFVKSYSGILGVQNAIQAASLAGGLLDGTEEGIRFDDQRAWLTKDGLIVIHWDRGLKFVRYDFENLTKKDSFTMSTAEGYFSASFTADGDYWYYFDPMSTRLFKLRTWWK